MKIHIIAIMLAALIPAGAALSAPFYLIHETTGKRFGPIHGREGERIMIGDAAFLVSTGITKKLTPVEALRLTVIPKIEFRQANLVDVIEYLRQASVMHSPVEDKKQKGVNIVLDLKSMPAEEIPRITVSLREVTLAEAMKVIAQVTGMRVRTSGNVIFIEPRGD